MSTNPRTRRTILLALLGLALVALYYRAPLQVWAYGLGEGAQRLLGAPVPELPAGAKTLDGEVVQLKALRGHVVLLHFFTRACGNCQTMLPRYSRWAHSFGGQGLDVIGVHTPETDDENDEGALRSFVRAQGILWRVVPDPANRIWDRFAIAAWPTALLIDRGGVVRSVYVGDHHDRDIASDIRRLLGP